MTESIKLNQSWKQPLLPEFEKPYMKQLKQFLAEQYQKGKTIYPKGNEYFAALNETPLPEVKVVILGQDPYHGPGQAHGLSFSVPNGVPVPPSLQNIYKELNSDLGVAIKQTGNLSDWASQGVLLLNSVLTVERAKAASHQGKGWEMFTDRIIHIVAEDPTPKVFMLWGAYAQKKAAFVNSDIHLVLKAPHPSPLSAHRGFLGCRHFSKANAFLESKGREPIHW